ncbi:MAG: XRE family transcriptional regulator [Salinibacterium sp.]|nr:MAG: XRE family transcriptional regulator [Salinibacterium sp.]
MNHSPIFGRVVAELRASRSMTQDAMSLRLGWPRGVLARIETGRTTAKITHIADVERLFIDEKLIDKAGDTTTLVGMATDILKQRDETVTPEGAELHRLAQRVVDQWLRRDLPGWPARCPVCGVYEGRCLVMHAPGSRSAPQPVSPRRFTKRPHSGREGGLAYYSGGSP